MTFGSNRSDTSKSKSVESNPVSPQTPIAPDRNILLIDDDEAVLRSIRRLFLKDFSLVITAGDKTSALQAINGLGMGDVIISDLELSRKVPGEGLEIAETTRQIRQEKGLSFILVSGTGASDNPDQINQALSTGLIDAFFQKPYDPRQLKTRIRTLLCPR